MQRLRRSLILLALSLLGTIAVLAYRTLDAFGVFTSVKPGFAGTCASLGTAFGAEDIAIDRPSRSVFLSVDTPNAAGIYTAALDDARRGATRLEGTPRDFHPRGISVFRSNDGSLTLMAINRPDGAEPRIEIFDVRSQRGRLALLQTTSISSGLLVYPKAIAAAGKSQFYVTNAFTSRTWLGRALETYAMLPRANVVYFGGDNFRIVADELNVATGIAISSDGAHVYVGSAIGRALLSYGRDALTGALTQEGKLSLPAALLSVSVGPNNDLWVAAEPKLHLDEKSKDERIPSEVFKIEASDGVARAAMPIFVDTGETISAAKTVAAADGVVFIGSNSKILACRP
jgi:arylesterase/paraoxonase